MARLLLIANNFPTPDQPTRGVFNLGMARALSRGHEVQVICPVSWVDEWRARRAGGALLRPGRVARVEGVEVHYPRYYYPPRVLRGQYGRFLWLSTRGTVSRLLKGFAPDVVIGYWAHPDGEVAVRAARRAGVPSVVMVGGSDVLVLGRDPARGRRIGAVLRAADAVVAVSRNLREEVLKFGVPPGNVHVVGRGVDTGRFHPGDRAEARRRLGIAAEGRVALWVGRMVPVKGLDVLIRACVGLRARGLGLRVYLVGDGPLRGALEAQAAGLGLTGMVHFVGPRGHDELADWYRAADLSVLPSHSEGIPNVLRESLACGTPFVASRVGGIPELSEEPPNRLVEPGSPSALEGAVAGLLSEVAPCTPLRFRVAGSDEAAAALSEIFHHLVTARVAGRPTKPADRGAPNR